MKYSETGFRPFYHNFCVLPITENTKDSLKDFPGEEIANGILTYGYYDSREGLTLEVLAAAQVKGEDASFGTAPEDTGSIIRIGDVSEDEFLFFDDDDGKLAERYADKIEMVHQYDADEEVEKSRDMIFLDPCRHKECIDDVTVYLMKEGSEPEGCRTRITGLGEHCIIGTLLNEPVRSLGYHEGEEISFFVQANDKNEVICYSNIVTAADLEDGSMLEAAVAKFNKERNEQNLLSIIEILRDSNVWVPCTAVTGEDSAAKDNFRLVPDILQNGEALYFPMFSTVKAMGDYGNDFSKIQKHMLEVITMAKTNAKEPVGIVLNAFSEPFVLDKEIWDIVEKMGSRIEGSDK
ncbi:MAG: SseB family protein [Eubacteriaceae bacterium]|nr:SseB family protein [Eubacteriaceae bacterium]